MGSGSSGRVERGSLGEVGVSTILAICIAAGKGVGRSSSIGVRGGERYRGSLSSSVTSSTVILNNSGLISGRRQVVEGSSARISTEPGRLSGVEQRVAEVKLVVERVADTGM